MERDFERAFSVKWAAETFEKTKARDVMENCEHVIPSLV
jgi:hypothetical protein